MLAVELDTEVGQKLRPRGLLFASECSNLTVQIAFLRKVSIVCYCTSAVGRDEL